MELILGIVAIIIIWKLLKFFIGLHIRKKRRQYLFDKYGNNELVDDLMDRRFWQGQTAEQLHDSLGNPDGIDKKVFKSKTKETWKYNEIRKNQFALRIFVEDEVVVGWEKK
jgi:hypothetical protein